MKYHRIVSVLLAAALLLSGCRSETEHPAPETASGTAADTTADSTALQTETTTLPSETTAPEPVRFTFNPHVYSPKLAQTIPQDHWDALYSLCDALRAGDSTFRCASQEAYDWVMDAAVLGHLCPAACMKISGKSSDGTTPFENGTGRIYYNMPAADYVRRQAEFEQTVTDVLNSTLEADDDDFEKCLKLYRYIAANFFYEEFPAGCGDGAYYYTLMNHKGVCDELSGVYMYYLLQVGIDALEIGCYADNMCHAWNYVILGGEGYHIDATWALMSVYGTEDLSLEYFMMTDEQRAFHDCPVDDLTVDLLPEYWANFSSLTFPATDGRYHAADYSTLDSLDETRKVMYYTDVGGESHELYYGEFRNPA
ncbi:MAG: hypothetical protein II723_02805 [Oscillospiraceae bacterium]|nr:hypothetical protein [Oscillospiraceae bacterium]